jgi:hypothetical protein
MNDKYLDMVLTMAQQLDTPKLEFLIDRLVSFLDNHHSLGDGTTQDLLTNICNNYGMYTTLSDEQNLTNWCASQLSAYDKLVFEDQAEVIQYLDNQDFYVFGTEKEVVDYVLEMIQLRRTQ